MNSYPALLAVSAVTISATMVSYPIDTIRRRMMMTSGEAVKYKGSMDCGIQIIRNEGAMSLMKGAGKFVNFLFLSLRDKQVSKEIQSSSKLSDVQELLNTGYSLFS